MTYKNAINKLKKGQYKIHVNDGRVSAIKNDGVIEFIKYDSSGKIDCIRVRGVNDKDDIMTDYFAGTWCDNLTQAMKINEGL